MPVLAATPGRRDMGPVPRLPTTLTLSHSHSHRLASLGLKASFASMVAQRVEETRRTKGGQCGRGISGEDRWECPEQTVLKSRLV